MMSSILCCSAILEKTRCCDCHDFACQVKALARSCLDKRDNELCRKRILRRGIHIMEQLNGVSMENYLSGDFLDLRGLECLKYAQENGCPHANSALRFTWNTFDCSDRLSMSLGAIG